ncbi:hypothetical protein [Cellulomonas sp. KRMCY2]|uniref:hypothetical protein n=1 Tax=Cellulomonas sp. KRMCY2 TaxID=1304865 RepID=UPI00045E7C32|nr:hypothetical protein [Cellulomonas sp. KRMCY2]
MDPGTAVALVLGGLGFVWSGFTYFRNERREHEREEVRAHGERAADREKRWVQEKRLIYVEMQRVLHDRLYAVANLTMHDPTEDGHEARQKDSEAAWSRYQEVLAEIDMLAPESVRQAIWDATNETNHLLALANGFAHHALRDDEDPSFDGAEWECHLALEAMRADLGVEPLPRTPRKTTWASGSTVQER